MHEWKVCDYTLAKRLAELGVDQSLSERVLVYVRRTPLDVWSELRRRDAVPRNDDEGLWLAAYDGCELGVALPEWYCSLPAKQSLIGFPALTIKLRDAKCSEANSRAAMLIWLLENGHITADDANRRLAKCLR